MKARRTVPYFVRWAERRVEASHLVVAPDERLAWGPSLALGVQHVVAMFGATVLAPLLMGFDPNVAILMSGVGTLLFSLAVGGRVPSYLGSSFAFIGAVNVVTGYAGTGPNPRLAEALGGIMACGAAYAAIGLVVMAVGVAWIEALMPPVVTGAVVMVIGLNLAPTAVRGATGTPFDAWVALLTIASMVGVAVVARGLLGRLLILTGLGLSYLLYAVLCNGLGAGPAIDFSRVWAAPFVGMPHWSAPAFRTDAVSIILPIAVILAAENLGHIKAVSAMTGENLEKYLGRAFVADGVATMVAGGVGGTGVTTYAENIGVMAVTRIYSTLPFVIAAVLAILLGFSPRFGALVLTIPGSILAGVSIVVFGLIAVSGARIWIVNRVDFADTSNLLIVAVTLALGTGDFTLHMGPLTLGGIGTATFGAMLLSFVLRRTGKPQETA